MEKIGLGTEKWIVTELFSQGICSPAKNVGLGICSHGIVSLPLTLVKAKLIAKKLN